MSALASAASRELCTCASALCSWLTVASIVLSAAARSAYLFPNVNDAAAPSVSRFWSAASTAAICSSIVSSCATAFLSESTVIPVISICCSTICTRVWLPEATALSYSFSRSFSAGPCFLRSASCCLLSVSCFFIAASCSAACLCPLAIASLPSCICCLPLAAAPMPPAIWPSASPRLLLIAAEIFLFISSIFS